MVLIKVKCITCLAKGRLKDAEVVYRGFSYCREHFINAMKEEEKIFKKMAEKEKKKKNGEIMEIGKEKKEESK